jgi:hypothetical protein
MSDPSEATHANPHPVSGHRTPREIAEDEAGRIGQPDDAISPKQLSGESAPQSPTGKPARATTSEQPANGE